MHINTTNMKRHSDAWETPDFGHFCMVRNTLPPTLRYAVVVGGGGGWPVGGRWWRLGWLVGWLVGGGWWWVDGWLVGGGWWRLGWLVGWLVG